jgi:asparagine N-glycosylation enzyme membrane subunit Stt3
VVWSLSVAAALAAGGCGGSSKSSTSSSGGSNAGALSAEAQSAATGDIPDNQVFLVYHNPSAGYTIKYPEGWTIVGSGKDVRFKDKNNLVHIVAGSGPAPTAASASAQLTALKRANPSLKITSPPKAVTINGRNVVKSGYSTESAPNSVTGKRVVLLVDRYQLLNKGKPVTVDLGTPKGVDNVDAYRMMIESFKSA